MAKKILLTRCLKAILVILTSGFFGCTNQATNTSITQKATLVNDNLPKVVATTSVICDLTRQVAENTVNLICLIPPNTKPQTYQPTANDIEAIKAANLIFYNGYNLEPELIKLINKTKNSAAKIAVAQIAVPRPQQFVENQRRLNNPYVWHNPQNASRMVEVINNNLKKLIPTNSGIYSNNTKRFKNEINQLDNWIRAKIATIPQEKLTLVTNYNAIDYYTKTYRIRSATFGREEKPTDQKRKNLVEYIEKSNTPTIFADMTDSSQLMKSTATEAQIKLSSRRLYTQALGEENTDGDTYQNMMVANTRTIVEGLGGTYLIFQPK